MVLRPDLWKRLDTISRPLKDDLNVDLLCALNEQGLLPEENRLSFVQEVRTATIEDADDSFLDYDPIARLLTDAERENLLDEVEMEVLLNLPRHINRLRKEWDNDYDPDDYFDTLRDSVRHFTEALAGRIDAEKVESLSEKYIQDAVCDMQEEYTPTPSSPVPVQQSAAKADSLDELFRDVDE